MKYKIVHDIKIGESSESLNDVFKITQSDLYQMFTYSDLYGADGSILVFPGGKNELSKRYNFKKDGTPLWILMLNLEFSKDEWEMELVSNVGSMFDEIIVSCFSS